MRRTESLRRTLQDLARVYNDGERVPVEFTSGTPHAKESHDGPRVAVAPNISDVYGVNVGGPDELRILVDTLSHEIEHVRSSDLHAKRDFMHRYPEAPDMAGTVYNIIEDLRIDARRYARRPGLRTTGAFSTDKLLANDARRPPMNSTRLRSRDQQVIEGLIQVAFAGYAKNIDAVDDDLREFLDWCREWFAYARRLDTTAAETEDISHVIMQRVLTILDDVGSADDYLGGARLPISVGPDGDVTVTFDDDEDDEPDRPDAWDDETDEPGADAPLPERDDAYDTTPLGGDNGPDDDYYGEDEKPETDGDGDDTARVGGGSGSATTLPDMDEMDDERESRDWHGVDETADYALPSREDIERYDRLQDRVKRERSDLGKRKKKRDERIETFRKHTAKPNNDKSRLDRYVLDYDGHQIATSMEVTGLARDIEDEFREIKSRDRPVASQRGQAINIRNTVRHMAGDYDEQRLFNRSQPVETGDRAVGVVLDLSSSMNEKQAKQALAALAIATEQIGDSFTAVGFREATQYPESLLVTAPDEDFDYDHLDSVSAYGSTPTAKGIRDMHGILKHATARQKVMIVVTDGRANCIDERDFDGMPPTYDATEMARRDLDAARDDGIPVLGLAVGSAASNVNALTTLFGPNGFVTGEMHSLHESLGEAYKRFLRTTPGA